MTLDDHPALTIIIPCHNAAQKVQPCLSSLRALNAVLDSLEVLFIDDRSDDNTVDILQSAAATHPNWQVITLEANSGSPSRPRNVGINAAQGQYVLFIDADDEVIVDSVLALLRDAHQHHADIVRSPLIVDNGKSRWVANRITDFPHDGTHRDQVISILTHQSTTVSTMVRTQLLREHDVRWPEDLRMGEDTVFLTAALLAATSIRYVDEPVQVYHKAVTAQASSTQQYGERELRNHLTVWSDVDTLLRPLDVRFFDLRGQVALQSVFEALRLHGTGDITRATHTRFQEYLTSTVDCLNLDSLRPRNRGSIATLLDGSYEDFVHDCKPRLLIAGYDLKFIRSAEESLSTEFTVRYDEWSGHDTHDPATSRDLLDWADVIWCEWLLGNAVWYAKHKRAEQRLIVRIHRFELTRSFGHQIAMDTVDAFVGVSVHTLEEAIHTFNLPREKTAVIPNYLALDKYTAADPHNESRPFDLAMVGIVPALKGYRRALDLLLALRAIDSRYTLTLYGKTPDSLPWLMRDPAERKYFEDCEHFIEDNGLTDYVRTAGWSDLRSTVHRHGFVLSMSDLESFHLAPAEAFATGNQGVFVNWRGVEYIYPARYIFSTVAEMAAYIAANRDLTTFTANAQEGVAHVRARYDVSGFTASVKDLVRRS
ncbi:glycosyltransferase [Devriesea agamarum]|uniref:glycosyltransferase n=1 Tax=Devriesea agamarum TaxID=472569 RepID=UPI00071E34E0|nr:glycosyltransferase [Devriesea agamarum]